MARKKDKPVGAKKTTDEILGEEAQRQQAIEDGRFWVETLDDLSLYLSIKKLNPMERVMSVNLLMAGYRFSPQHKINLPEGWVINGRKYFLADFLLDDRIIVETDGKIHEEKETKEKDRSRDNALTALGYHVFHFTWDEVMENLEGFSIFGFIDHLQVLLTTYYDIAWSEGYEARKNESIGDGV
jgi:very-short-patch-repair endonuclease